MGKLHFRSIGALIGSDVLSASPFVCHTLAFTLRNWRNTFRFLFFDQLFQSLGYLVLEGFGFPTPLLSFSVVCQFSSNAAKHRALTCASSNWLGEPIAAIVLSSLSS